MEIAQNVFAHSLIELIIVLHLYLLRSIYEVEEMNTSQKSIGLTYDTRVKIVFTFVENTFGVMYSVEFKKSRGK